jgi:hypothetical protein
MSRQEMDNALEALVNDGRIYNTCDDHHFKTIDG